MKPSPNKFLYGLTLTLILATLEPAQAKNTSDLKLHCKGTYQVISAVPSFIPAPTYPTRAPLLDKAGAMEQIKILMLKGLGCEKLKLYYGIDLQVGMILPYYAATSPATLEQANFFAEKELGKTHSFGSSQSFQYSLADGTLPFFPMVHEEYVQVLNLYGIANSKALYGTPSLEELDDETKNKVGLQLFSMSQWGLNYQGNNSADIDQWLQLLLHLEFKNSELELEFLQNLVLVFSNMTKQTSQFFIYSPANLVAKKISFLLNKHGKSKWNTKLEILKINPALLNQQGVFWSNPNEVLNLSSPEIEDFLSYALVQVKNLSSTPQISEAQTLKTQYVSAAIALNASPIGESLHFQLTQKSQELIEQIVSL